MNVDQRNHGLLMRTFYLTRCTASQATHWNFREEIYSVRQMMNFKDMHDKFMNIFKSMSKKC